MRPPFDPARVRALCFDLDGTLVDTDDAYTARLAAILRRIPLWAPGSTPEHTARRWILAAEGPANFFFGLPDRFGLDEPFGRFSDWLAARRGAVHAVRLPLISGIRPALELLAARYPLALVSARDGRATQAILRAHNLEPLFRCVATARTVPRTKPHPAPVLWAAAQMSVLPEACLMVGDTPVDIIAGHAAGAQTVGVLCGFGERWELERAGANLILEATPGLVAVLMGDG